MATEYVAGRGADASRATGQGDSRYVGRDAELAFLERLLEPGSAANVVLVHGPSGIGKSALLRELGRRAERRGWTCRIVDGRDLPPMVGELERALDGVQALERPLVMLDSYERMAAIGPHLRSTILPALPASALVVIAGRRAPEHAWLEGGWERVAVDLELAGMTRADGRRLLASRGVTDSARAGLVLEWAAGSPLAMTLAADALHGDPAWTPTSDPEPTALIRRLARSSVSDEDDARYAEALSVAAIARVTTAPLLRAVLPEVAAAEAMSWLDQRTFAERLGDGVKLHDVVARAVRRDLEQRAPDRARGLRRRIADVLYARAIDGSPRLAIDLAHLVRSDIIRAHYGAANGADFRIDALRPGDGERIAALLGSRGQQAWWPSTSRILEEAPEQVGVARDSGERLCGYLVTMSLATVPPCASADPLLGQWLSHARAREEPDRALVWRDDVDFTREVYGEPDPCVRALLGMAGTLRGGIDNPRYVYVPIDPRDPTALVLTRILGAVEVPELEVRVEGAHRTSCYLIDFGPGGVLAYLRDQVHRELGVSDAAAQEGGGTPFVADVETVREALRNLHRPAVLATSPLGTGANEESRAASVRELFEQAVGFAFGDSAAERALRMVLERGYFESGLSHEAVADELGYSRTTYFRQLRVATQRLADCIGAMQRGT